MYDRNLVDIAARKVVQRHHILRVVNPCKKLKNANSFCRKSVKTFL